MDFEKALKKKFEAGAKGGLTLIRELNNTPQGKRRGIFQCFCGLKKEIRISHVKYGETKSCGCLAGKSITHGKSKTRIYRIWTEMMKRCYNPKVVSYKRYGGRGIKVVARWHEFEKFNKDMVNTYRDDLTLDRINNSWDYSPMNCRWATYTEQARNKRNTITLTYKNQTKPLADWAEVYNIHYKCLYKRIKVLGWDTKKALEK